MTSRTIGILTGGGDCPGLNAVIRAIAKTALHDYNWKVTGILDGYEGLVKGKSKNLAFDDVSNILTLGGTILGTSNKANPFEYYDAPPRQRRGGIRSILPLEGGGDPLASSGKTRLQAGGGSDQCHPLPIPLPSRERECGVAPPQAAGNHLAEKGGSASDLSDQAVANLKKWDMSALFCIGGDGTLSIASRLMKKWPKVIGIPKTIDNDLSATDQTFGFDSACSFVTEAIDRIHSTAQSHHRVMVIEVMGRYAGWIALEGGMAGGGDIILIPEMPFSFEKVAEVVSHRAQRGKRFSLIVVAEGARPKGEDYCVKKIVADSPDRLRLGGIGNRVADEVERMTGHESRVTVLGHLQRGGSPTFFDRILATRYGVEAARLANKGIFGKMVALRGAEIVPVDLEDAIGKLRTVPPDHALVKAAESLGTSFGV